VSGSSLVASRLSSRRGRHPPRGPLRPARRLGRPAFDLHGQGELLALTYSLGGLAVVIAWFFDPSDIGNRAGMAALLVLVFAAAAVMYGLRNHPPRYTGDAAIVGSLVLIDVGLFFTKVHAHPGLLSPFFVWVGVASPLWFPRRRAILYVFLAIVASGIVIVVAATSAALAGWVITAATLVVAFCITSFLTDALVKRERLAVVGEMASVVGHDLRNPLAAVSNVLFLLRDGLGADLTQDQERHFRMADREIAKAAAIIHHLGAFVRPSPPTMEPIPLSALITEVFEVAPAGEGVDVTVDIEPITLHADRGQLAEVLTNLITNAYDAVGEHGSLRVTASIEGQVAIIQVEDDGPGIDRSLEERVFEPFYTEKYQGTGLGLAIVRRLVEAHGGTVKLDVDAPKGTRFIVRLPHAEPRTTSDVPNEAGGPSDPTVGEGPHEIKARERSGIQGLPGRG
jgi:signal transduction histidine kinase